MYPFIVSGGLTIASFAFPVLYAIPFFDIIVPTHNAAAKWGWWVTPSLSYVGQGIVMGPQTTISMFAGAIIGWAILSPIVHHLGWTNGIPTDGESGSQAWILWIALAIMTSESVVSLVTQTILQLFCSDNVANEGFIQDVEPILTLAPKIWIIIGFILSTFSATVFLYGLFSESNTVLPIWVPPVGIFLAALLSILAIRSLGATDLNPVNAIGKVWSKI